MLMTLPCWPSPRKTSSKSATFASVSKMKNASKSFPVSRKGTAWSLATAANSARDRKCNQKKCAAPLRKTGERADVRFLHQVSLFHYRGLPGHRHRRHRDPGAHAG